MQKRFVSIWFRYLKTDWFSLHDPQLRKLPFVLRAPSHGRMVITSVNAIAEHKCISIGMALTDARALEPDLQVRDDMEDLPQKLLQRLGEWGIRFTPVVSVDLPDGLILDATGCAHLWGGEERYIRDITGKLSDRGYSVSVTMADTIGLAWGQARFGGENRIVTKENHMAVLAELPPEALRIETEIAHRLHQLGLHRIGQFIQMPRSSLLRRFGPSFIHQLNKAIGQEMEIIEALQPPEPYQMRLPCMEPIVTAEGIEIALNRLLEDLCKRLEEEHKGMRVAVFKGYRIDGKIESIEIKTNRPSRSAKHLFKLFNIKLATIEPALGIELFVLEAGKVEDLLPGQDEMWESNHGLSDLRLVELLDRISNKIGPGSVNRYLPTEHFWPERSYKKAQSISEEPSSSWKEDRMRPLQLLKVPEKIEVAAPIPDYPPMLFRHKNKLHNIVNADGPERIEQEWWLQSGQHRDYYRVEDEEGNRYWIFRLGHYDDKSYQWFLHGFFA